VEEAEVVELAVAVSAFGGGEFDQLRPWRAPAEILVDGSDRRRPPGPSILSPLAAII
jgi:hypothetical protein